MCAPTPTLPDNSCFAVSPLYALVLSTSRFSAPVVALDYIIGKKDALVRTYAGCNFLLF